MARTEGMLNLSGNLEVNAGAPLDARSIVPTVADLTVAANFQYKYVGMPVVVQATGDQYILMDMDVTDIANWKLTGSGSGGTFTVNNNLLYYNEKLVSAIDSYTIYVNESTGVNDVDSGYGFSSNKPFKTIEYAIKFIAPIGVLISGSVNVRTPLISLVILSDITNTSYTQYRIEDIKSSLRISTNNTAITITKGGFEILNCNFVYFDNANITFDNSGISVTSHMDILRMYNNATVAIWSNSTLTFTGNSEGANQTTYNFCAISARRCTKFESEGTLVVNSMRQAIDCETGAYIYFQNLSGTGNNVGIQSFKGGILCYATKSISATIEKETNNGGRIYTGG